MFLIHPRTSVQEDMARVFPLFKWVPEWLLSRLMLKMTPIVKGKVRYSGQKEVAGWIIVVPLAASQFLTLPRPFLIKRIVQAIRKAEKLGAKIVGLGEFTSVVTRAGTDFGGEKPNCFITTGNSLTASFSVEAINRISASLGLPSNKTAIIGATGSVGNGISWLLAKQGVPLLLISKKQNLHQLSMLKQAIENKFPGSQIEVAADLVGIKQAMRVVVTTSATNEVVKSEDLAFGALVYDITQPHNTSPKICQGRPDLTVVDGGIVSVPGVDFGMDIGLPPGQAYACLVETMLLARFGKEFANYIGPVDCQTAEDMLKLMVEHSDFFKFGPFQSFGIPISLLQDVQGAVLSGASR